MQATCHRCGGDLPSSDELSTFCPHCGAPQLFLAEGVLATEAIETTGALPPPSPREVDWRVALGSAAIVAGIAAVLTLVAIPLPRLSFLSTVWLLTASVTTLALYQRRRPLAWMDAGIGARIGLTAGLSSITCTAVALALAGVVARFGMHTMTEFDVALVQMLAQVKATAAAASTPAPPEVLRLYDIPEFQAGIVLASLAFAGVMLLAFNTCGGALGGLLRARRPARP